MNDKNSDFPTYIFSKVASVAKYLINGSPSLVWILQDLISY